MLDPFDDLYKEVREEGIPPGFLRDIRRALHDFKAPYRTSYKLLAMRTRAR